MKLLSKLWSLIISVLLTFSSPGLEKKLILSLIRKRAERSDPAEALRFLFEIDAGLYQIEQRQAGRYGDGIHPKHKMLDFHQFFYKRIKADERVLDIGSHEGELVFDIASKTGAKITGIELVPERVAVARQRNAHPNVTYIQGDVTAYLPDEPFDVIVMSNVLEHLPERVEFLRKAQQNSRAKRFLIRVPRFDRDWRVPLKKEIGVDWRLDDEHTIEYTPESFEQEMTEAGLRIEHLESRWGEFWAELSVIAQ